ncbi:hypothetical protein [Novosphingobium sp.]|uniref:hypothetical protein n=1 Tax=Novosphingobium sp. TaxID=1874826 RepID=UPI00352AFD2B
MVAIACLGWGSLYWNPDGLPVGAWREDGPELPLEFARLSGGGRVTLVVMPDGPRVPTLWTLLDVGDLAAGMAALRKRENTKSAWIGRWPTGIGSLFEAEISEWAAGKGLDGVVWTAIPPKWNNEDGRVPTEDEVVSYLTGLQGAATIEPFKYVRNAPPQIQTPYRPALARVVGA